MADADPTLQSGIYQIRNSINGKLYIGSAVHFGKRWIAHRAYLNKGKHHSKSLQSAWLKYGADAFVFEILEIVPAAELLAVEQAYLDRMQPFSHQGYNICGVAGSVRGITRSPETRERMAACKRGLTHTAEARAKIGAAAKGRILTSEQKAKQSAALSGREFTLEHRAALTEARKGRVTTDECRANLSEAHKGIPQSEETRAKRSAALKGRVFSAESIAKMKAAAQAREERRRLSREES